MAYCLRFSKEEHTRIRRNYEKHCDSVVQKRVYRVTGNKAKFAETLEQEENKMKQVSKTVEQLESTIAELESKKTNALIAQRALECDCKRRKTAEEEINALFTSIFPHDSVPSLEVGDAERKLQRALYLFTDSLGQHEANLKVEQLLEEAAMRIRSCLSHIKLAMNRFNSFCHLSGRFCQLMMAHDEVYKANLAFLRAMNLSREVQDTRPNGKYDLAGNNIDEFYRDAKRYSEVVSHELSAAHERFRNSKSLIIYNAHLVQDAGNERKKARQDFIRTLVNDDLWEDPPSYSRDDYSTASLPSYSEHDHSATSPPPYSHDDRPTTSAQEESRGTMPMSRLSRYGEGSSFQESHQEES
ncbi:hypothetical protein F5Y03DRAFT_372581 [Xylaria venustula]|nr:hypothetical protein F5Y03DRAFT_372581 [Xylaria venustula]